MPVFLAPWFLVATAAAAIPVALHLLHRRKPKPVPFSSLRFLAEAVAKTRRSRNLTNFLVLLMRVLILLLLALAFAQPKVRFASWLPEGKRTIILIVDGSASMRMIDGDKNCFDRAREWSLQLLRSLQQGDQVAFIVAGLPEPRRVFPPISDRETLLHAVQEAEPGYGKAKLLTLLNDVLRRLGDNKHNFGTEIHIFSDFQDEELTVADMQALASDLNDREMLLFLNRVQPTIEANAGILKTSFFPPAIVGDGNFTLRTTVHSGKDFNGGAVLSLNLEGEQQTKKTLELLPDQKATFIMAGKAAGQDNIVKGTLELGPDVFEADNRYYFTLPRINAVPLLIVNGNAQNNEAGRDAFFLERAIKPPGQARTIFVPQMMNWQNFLATDLAAYRLVYVINPPALDDAAIAKLENYVSNSGSVVLMPGQGKNFGSNIRRIKPCSSLSIKQEEVLQEKSLSIVSSPKASALEKRILAIMPSPTAIVVRQRLHFDALPPDAATVFHFADGSPFLVEVPYEQGTFWIASVSANRDWSEWPLTPFFVILQQELIKLSAGRNLVSRLVEVGDVLPLDWNESGSSFEFRLIPPDGKEKMISATRSSRDQPLLINGFHQPGFHLLKHDKKTETVAVNVPQSESSNSYLQPEELKYMFQNVPFFIAENWQQQERNLVNLHKGRPLWPLLLTFAFLLAVTEEIFANLRSNTSRLPDALRQFLTKGVKTA